LPAKGCPGRKAGGCVPSRRWDPCQSPFHAGAGGARGLLSIPSALALMVEKPVLMSFAKRSPAVLDYSWHLAVAHPKSERTKSGPRYMQRATIGSDGVLEPRFDRKETRVGLVPGPILEPPHTEARRHLPRVRRDREDEFDLANIGGEARAGRTHQPRITCHISSENGGEAAGRGHGWGRPRWSKVRLPQLAQSRHAPRAGPAPDSP
jgi:hypothetical protein